jgi:hypothetical protein
MKNGRIFTDKTMTEPATMIWTTSRRISILIICIEDKLTTIAIIARISRIQPVINWMKVKQANCK